MFTETIVVFVSILAITKVYSQIYVFTYYLDIYSHNYYYQYPRQNQNVKNQTARNSVATND